MKHTILTFICAYLFSVGLSITTAHAQPANNDCGSATALTVQPNSCTTQTNATVVGATDSGERNPATDCGLATNTYVADTWFSLTVPPSGEVTIQTSPNPFDDTNSFTDPIMAVYSGSCGGLTVITCDLAANTTFTPGFVTVFSYNRLVLTAANGISAGETLYVLIYNNQNGSSPGSYDICAWDPNPVACPEINQNVNHSESFCQSGTPDYATAANSVSFSSTTNLNTTGTVNNTGINFWLDANHTMTAGALTYSGNGCDAQDVTIYAFAECDHDGSVGTDAFIAAGTFTVTLYPDIQNQTNTINNAGGCCPSITAQCASTAGYTITNDFDANGATPGCSTASGNITFTITNTNAPATGFGTCRTHTIMTTYVCSTCPTVDQNVNHSETICDGATPDYMTASGTVQYTDANSTINTTGTVNNSGVNFWLTNTNPPTMAAGAIAHSGTDNCATETVTVYAFIECDENQNGFNGGADDAYIAAGSFDVTVYPDINNQNNVVSTAACCPTITLECGTGYTVTNSLDGNGASPDCSSLSNASNFTFTVTSDNAPNTLGDCYEVTYNATYNCTACPTVDQDVNHSETLCDGATPDYTTASGTVQYTDGSSTINTTGTVNSTGVNFWLTNTNPPTMSAGAIAHSGTDNCATETVTVYAFIECDLNQDGFNGGTDDSFIAAGSFDVTVYPDINNQTNVVSTAACCPTITLECGTGYTVTNSLDGNGASPDCSSLSNASNFTFTVTSDNAPNTLGDCYEVTYNATYNCTACPTVDQNVNHTETLCDGATPDYTTASGTVQYTDGSSTINTTGTVNSTGVNFWLTNTNPPTMSAGAIAHSGTDNCVTETVTVYAFIECDLNQDGFNGGTDDSFIAAGSFDVTVYPDINNQTNVVSTAACCPTITLECATGYTVTNSLDGNGDSPDCSSFTDANSFTFTVTSDNAPNTLGDCYEVVYNATYNCFNCPTVTQSLTQVEHFCETGMVDYSVLENDITFSDPGGTENGISFWLENAAVPTTPASNTFTYNGDGCATQTDTVYAYIECDEDMDGTTDSYIMAGTLTVNTYPDIATQNNTLINGGGCCPSVQLACPNGYSIINDFDANGGSPNCGNTFDNGSITFTITNDNAPANLGTCSTHDMAATYACTECPTVTNALNETEEFCGGGQLDFTTAMNAISFNDPSGTANGISFWLESTNPQTPATATVSYDGDGCATDNQVIYAFVECDEDMDGQTDTYVPAGTITVNIYPDLANVQLVGDGTCCPGLDFDCTAADGYTVTNSFDNNGAAPVCDNTSGNGAMNFTITNNNAPFNLGNCRSRTFVASFDCRECPEVTADVNWSEEFCVEGNPNFNGAAATVGVSDPSNTSLGVTFWLDNPPVTPAPFYVNYTGNGCDPQTLTVFAFLGCDKDQNQVRDGQIPAGSFDITLYPKVQAPTINKLTAADGECTYEVVPACPTDQLNPSTFGPLAIPSAGGELDIAVTSGILGTLCTAPETFTVDYEACGGCPFEIEIVEIPNGNSVTPFSYNVTKVNISGAVLPLSFDWERSGSVRYRVAYNNGEATITIYTQNGASWAVTITDALGCTDSASNNNDGNTVLNIDDYTIIHAKGVRATGSIDLDVSGGTMPYTYQWGGPRGFTANTEDISGLQYGWYRVTITDSSNPPQQTVGFYYISNKIIATLNGGFVRGKLSIAQPVFLQATPNPLIDQTTIQFALAEDAQQARVSIYAINGQKMMDVYQGTVQADKLNQFTVHADGLAAGTYIVQLTTETGVQQQTKIVVVR